LSIVVTEGQRHESTQLGRLLRQPGIAHTISARSDQRDDKRAGNDRASVVLASPLWWPVTTSSDREALGCGVWR